MIAFSRWTANLRGPVSHRCALPSKCGSGRPLRCRRCCWSRRGACCAPGRRRCAKASPSPSPPTRSRFAACCCCPAALHMHPNSASGCTLHVVCCSHAKLRSPSRLPCSSSAGRWRRFLARGSRRGPRAAATCSATAFARSAPQVCREPHGRRPVPLRWHPAHTTDPPSSLPAVPLFTVFTAERMLAHCWCKPWDSDVACRASCVQLAGTACRACPPQRCTTTTPPPPASAAPPGR